MDIISIVNTIQPNTIKRFALKQQDFSNGESGVPFMGGFAQLFNGATLPDPAAVTAYIIPVPVPPTPDLATQLTAALIAKGILTADDIDPKTLTTVDETLAKAQLPTIK